MGIVSLLLKVTNGNQKSGLWATVLLDVDIKIQLNLTNQLATENISECVGSVCYAFTNPPTTNNY